MKRGVNDKDKNFSLLNKAFIKRKGEKGTTEVIRCQKHGFKKSKEQFEKHRKKRRGEKGTRHFLSTR